MAHSVEMPELGESVTEGTITTWLKSVGDSVEVDEPLLEVSTDKVDTEIPSPVSGVLLEIKAEEDDTVEVGSVIAIVGDADEKPSSDDSGDAAKDDAPAEEEPKAEEPAEETPSAGSGDATDVEMPELGESVTEGTITTWLKSVGDTVEVDEPLLEVSTDKVDTEIPSPVAGTIVEILAEEDDTIEVGAVIARIGDANAAPAKKDDAPAETKPKAEEPKAEEPKAEAPKQEDKPKAEAPKAEKPAAAPAGSTKVDNAGKVPYVTPLVRKLADKHGVDLNTIEGTGVGGRIRKQDVIAAAEGGATATGAVEQKDSGPRARWSTKSVDAAKAELIGTTQKVNRIREITASKMVESLQTTAQLTHVQEADVTRVAELRKSVKPAFVDKHGVNITYLHFFVKATAEALVQHPNVNASYNAETKEITYHDTVNIGIAVDLSLIHI